MTRYLLAVLAVLWLSLGVLGFITLSGGQRAGEFGYDILMIPAMLLSSVGVQEGTFTDAAHGPPFLTIVGVCLVYILPGMAVSLVVWFGGLGKRDDGTTCISPGFWSGD
jgi:hypothetical protein